MMLVVMRPSHFFLLAACLLVSTPAVAQETSDERVDQLEQDVLLLKRQLERARLSGSSSEAAAPSEGGDITTARTNVRISTLEEEVRSLRGQIEQKDFETRRLTEDLEKFKRDAEFRFTELEKAAQAPAPAPAAAEPEKPAKKDPQKPAKKPEVSVKGVPADTAPPAKEDTATTEAEAAAPTADTPRDNYNYAFRLLNQNQYEEAAKSFAQFTKKYPKDPLVGNAYYWQGETYYIRKDFTKAVDHFRQGFEAMPKGPKAADNLLKLGMSLAALKKKEEACVVLSQVMTKYKASSANVATKAHVEHQRIGCGE